MSRTIPKLFAHIRIEHYISQASKQAIRAPFILYGSMLIDNRIGEIKNNAHENGIIM